MLLQPTLMLLQGTPMLLFVGQGLGWIMTIAALLLNMEMLTRKGMFYLAFLKHKQPGKLLVLNFLHLLPVVIYVGLGDLILDMVAEVHTLERSPLGYTVAVMAWDMEV